MPRLISNSKAYVFPTRIYGDKRFNGDRSDNNAGEEKRVERRKLNIVNFFSIVSD